MIRRRSVPTEERAKRDAGKSEAPLATHPIIVRVEMRPVSRIAFCGWSKTCRSGGVATSSCSLVLRWDLHRPCARMGRREQVFAVQHIPAECHEADQDQATENAGAKEAAHCLDAPALRLRSAMSSDKRVVSAKLSVRIASPIDLPSLWQFRHTAPERYSSPKMLLWTEPLPLIIFLTETTSCLAVFSSPDAL